MLEPTWKIPKKPRRKYIDNDGEKMPSVTEVLDALGWNKSALMGWANKIGRGGQTIAQVRNPKADAGSLAHHLIECSLTGVSWADTQEWHEALPEIQEKAAAAFQGWQNWWAVEEAKGWKIIECEIAMQSKHRGFAGTCDLLLRDDEGKYWVADIKTGSPHSEAAIQMAGYAALLSETRDIHCQQGMIIHVPTDGRPVTAHHITYAEMDDAMVMWGHLLEIHYLKEVFTRMAKRIEAATPKLEEPKGPF